MTVLLSLLLNPTVLAILAGIFGALGWGIRQRMAGRKDVADQLARDRAKAIKDKKELDDEIADLGPADLDVRFKRWLQDDDR